MGTVEQVQAVAGVVGDDVARTDHVVVHAVEQLDAVRAVGDGAAAGGVRADVVAQDGDVPRLRVLDTDAVSAIAADDVALGCCGPAHGDVCRSVLDDEAFAAIGHRSRAVRVQADDVAAHLVVPAAVHLDAGVGVATEQVPFDDNLLGAGDIYPMPAIGQRRCAAGIGADAIAYDGVAVRASPNRDPVAEAASAVTGDNVVGADGIVMRTVHDLHAALAIGNGRCAVGVGANPVLADHVLLLGTCAADPDAGQVVPADDIAIQLGAASTAYDLHAMPVVAEAGSAVGGDADVVVCNGVVARARATDQDATQFKTANVQAANLAVAGADVQAVSSAGAGTRKHDLRAGGIGVPPIGRLGRPVDGRAGVGQFGQGAVRRDQPHRTGEAGVCVRNVERNDIGTTMRVGAQNRLPQ